MLSPVRKIGIQSRSMTGTMPNGNRYESALERDLMILLEFDVLVDTYSPQPVVIRYQDRDAVWRRYTPDGLIQWRADLQVYDPRPVLVEVKYRESFQGNWAFWIDRFRAVHRYCQEQGWVYKVYTEREIRTPFLENVKFLMPYRDYPVTAEIEMWVLDKLSDLDETCPKELISSLFLDQWNQAQLIPVLWRLLAERRIGCDLTQRLNMQTPIWVLGD
jgi:hypothetical protein